MCLYKLSYKQSVNYPWPFCHHFFSKDESVWNGKREVSNFCYHPYLDKNVVPCKRQILYKYSLFILGTFPYTVTYVSTSYSTTFLSPLPITITNVLLYLYKLRRLDMCLSRFYHLKYTYNGVCTFIYSDTTVWWLKSGRSDGEGTIKNSPKDNQIILINPLFEKDFILRYQVKTILVRHYNIKSLTVVISNRNIGAP